MKVISGVYWDQGLRSVNQDSIILQQAMTSKGRVMMAAVSDGIGGLKEGEVASGYITERLIENFYKQMVPMAGRGKGKEALKRSLLRCFYDSNDKLKKYAHGKNILLGATVSLLFLWGRQYMIMHLGDSRIYQWRSLFGHEKEARQLTKDHSDGGSGLMKCIGSFPFQYPDICFGRIYGKSGFLLCTDGFYRKLDREGIKALIPKEIDNEEQIYKRLKMIAAQSFKKGEKDNISAVYTLIC